MNKLLIVCGPTATGKTSLAIELAKKFRGELVSADSRQVYKGLDGLTGKGRSQDIPIWLYDVVAPGDEFSVAHFVRLARARIGYIEKQGRLPIVVGGTGFYLRALTETIDTIFIPPDWELRTMLATLSLEELQKRLNKKRFEKMNESDQKNPRRLIRAIEIEEKGIFAPPPSQTFDALWIGLIAAPSALKRRIQMRIRARFALAVHEARDNLPPILGAKQVLAFKRGKLTREEAIARWQTEDYQYVKRQLTWFRKEKDIHWFDVTEPDFRRRIIDTVRSWYT